jgi:hypothetical protein
MFYFKRTIGLFITYEWLESNLMNKFFHPWAEKEFFPLSKLWKGSGKQSEISSWLCLWILLIPCFGAKRVQGRAGKSALDMHNSYNLPLIMFPLSSCVWSHRHNEIISYVLILPEIGVNPLPLTPILQISTTVSVHTLCNSSKLAHSYRRLVSSTALWDRHQQEPPLQVPWQLQL